MVPPGQPAQLLVIQSQHCTTGPSPLPSSSPPQEVQQGHDSRYGNTVIGWSFGWRHVSHPRSKNPDHGIEPRRSGLQKPTDSHGGDRGTRDPKNWVAMVMMMTCASRQSLLLLTTVPASQRACRAERRRYGGWQRRLAPLCLRIILSWTPTPSWR